MPKLKTKRPIHDTLTGYDFRVDQPLNRPRAIRQKCLECCGGNHAEVTRCHIYDCTLWPWRRGTTRKSLTGASDSVGSTISDEID